MSSLCLAGLAALAVAQASQVTAENAPSGATVVTAEDIARDKPVSIMALLREKVGIDEQGGQVSMRGVKGVAVVLDGVPQSTIPTYLTPEDVERIEIIRGAASSRYGASAMGGAVVIRTKGGEAWKVDAIGALGSFGRHRERIIATGRRAGSSFRFSAQNSFVKRAYEVRPGDAPFTYLENTQDDTSASQSFEAGLAYRGERLEADLKASYERASNNLGRPNWRLETEELSALARVNVALLPWLEIAPVLSLDFWPQYGGTRDKGTGTDPDGLAPDQSSQSTSYSGSFELQVSMSRWQWLSLVLGGKLGFAGDRGSDRDYASQELRFEYRYRTTHDALFVVAQAKPHLATTLGLSLRWDRYRYLDVLLDDGASRIEGKPLSKSALSPKLEAAWRVSGAFSVRASAGTGFVPPPPTSLYYENLTNPGSRTLSNPGLRPERSLSTDAGVDLNLPYVEAGLTSFYSRWIDKVEQVYSVSGATVTRQAQNIGESDSRGLELQAKAKVGAEWSAFANYTYNRTRITKSDADPTCVGHDVPDMPRHKLNLGFLWEREDAFSFRALYRYIGARFLDDKNTVRDENGHLWRRDAYHVLDFTFVKHFSFRGLLKTVDLTLTLENALDSRYGRWFFYRDPGRLVMLETVFKL
jgi:outer membrane receptor protein involved in Fe transport